MDALSVDNLCVTVSGRHLLENITFSVKQGRVVAIIGPNGAGKTTLVRAILGLIPYQQGSVLIYGLPAGDGELSSRVGYVPQKLEFDRSFPLTVSELLHFTVPPAFSFPFHKRKHEDEHIVRLLEIVGAQDLKDRNIGGLSGGELQRVMIAKAIVNDPGILFLDEPSSGVDIEGQERFHDLVMRLNKEHDLTVILISHDLNVVYRYADDVLCLNRKLVCSGKPAETLTDEVIKSIYGEMMGGYIHSCHDHD